MANKVETVPGTTPYLGKEQVTGLSSAKPLADIPDGARWAIAVPEDQAVRVELGGNTPTSADMLVAVGQPLEITSELANVRFLEEAASAKVNVWYFG